MVGDSSFLWHNPAVVKFVNIGDDIDTLLSNLLLYDAQWVDIYAATCGFLLTGSAPT